jgi:hypothetical protein
MTYRHRAIEVLDAARKGMRDIMAEAVIREAFGEVTVIARAAEELAHITGSLRGPADLGRPGEPRELMRDPASDVVIARPEVPPAAEAMTSPIRRQEYPQYFRESDRLVKRAWSKKERQPYEHKAPREVIEVLVNAMQARRGHQKPFEAVDILPLHRSNGEEYPSYQAYLVLGWLRHSGAIAKGREGYLLRSGWNHERIAQLWDALPSVA